MARDHNGRPKWGKSPRRAHGGGHHPEPYDRKRDYLLDFPDDPQAEPTTDDVKDRGYWSCEIDESAGLRGAQR